MNDKNIKLSLKTVKYKALAHFLLFLGLILRLGQYLFNRSLWLDESALALNIINKNFHDLFLPLSYGQIAPFGFLLSEKFLINSFGISEYVLRLFPLISSIFALILFYYLIKKTLSFWSFFVSLGLFVFSSSLIYYASELKQYSSDLFFGLICMVLFVRLIKRGINFSRFILFFIFGSISLLCSFSSIFILMSLLVYWFIFYSRKSLTKENLWFLFLSVFWLSFFSIAYVFLLKDALLNPSIAGYWQEGFSKGMFFSVPFFNWIIDTFLRIFNNPLGLTLNHLGGFLFLLGCFYSAKEDKKFFWLFFFPILFTFIFSLVHLYPFKSRLIIFLVPFFVIFTAKGAEFLINLTKDKFPFTGFILIIMLFIHPVSLDVYHLFKPRKLEEMNRVVDYLSKNIQKDDKVYVYYSSEYAFKYYLKKLNLTDINYHLGVYSRGNLGNYLKDINTFKGDDRVWFIFSHNYNWQGFDEERFFLSYLNHIGRLLDSFRDKGAEIYLYDLSV